jgi:hypothetical protein
MSQIYNVFRNGSKWQYSLKGVVCPELFDSRDDALFFAESAAIKLLKDEAAKEVESKPVDQKAPPEPEPVKPKS